LRERYDIDVSDVKTQEEKETIRNVCPKHVFNLTDIENLSVRDISDCNGCGQCVSIDTSSCHVWNTTQARNVISTNLTDFATSQVPVNQTNVPKRKMWMDIETFSDPKQGGLSSYDILERAILYLESCSLQIDSTKPLKKKKEKTESESDSIKDREESDVTFDNTTTTSDLLSTLSESLQSLELLSKSTANQNPLT